MRDTWMLDHGPDRSHDRLVTQRFDRLRDARAALADLAPERYWRIVKIAGGPLWSYHAVTTVDKGGPDVERERTRARHAAQYHGTKGR